jgi:hypothetical protein
MNGIEAARLFLLAVIPLLDAGSYRCREAASRTLQPVYNVGADPAAVHRMLAEMQVLEVEWTRRHAEAKQPER